MNRNDQTFFTPNNVIQTAGEVVINGEKFSGIAYKGLLTLNEVTFVESPERANDGSLSSINDIDTFTTPQLQIKFHFINITDYQRFKRATSAREFPVTYYDKQFGSQVTRMMYMKPESLTDIFNVETTMIGVLEYTVDFVGTNNDVATVSISYSTNGGSGTLPDSQTTTWGKQVVIGSASGISYSGHTFKCWNTRSNGTGWNYYPNQSVSIYESMTLYAIWE